MRLDSCAGTRLVRNDDSQLDLAVPKSVMKASDFVGSSACCSSMYIHSLMHFRLYRRMKKPIPGIINKPQTPVPCCWYTEEPSLEGQGRA